MHGQLNTNPLTPYESTNETAFGKELETILAGAKEEILKEYERTKPTDSTKLGNSWFECFASVLNQINLLVLQQDVEHQIGQTRKNQIAERIDELNQKRLEMSRSYTDRSVLPKEEDMNYLLDALNRLAY